MEYYSVASKGKKAYVSYNMVLKAKMCSEKTDNLERSDKDDLCENIEGVMASSTMEKHQ